MATGFIRRIFPEKRFGFIGVNGGDDCFFRAEHLIGAEWSERLTGQRVSFEIMPGRDDKFRAVNVQPLE